MAKHFELSYGNTNLGSNNVIIGIDWPHSHNPEVDWNVEKVQLSHCPVKCKPKHKKKMAKEVIPLLLLIEDDKTSRKCLQELNLCNEDFVNPKESVKTIKKTWIEKVEDEDILENLWI